MAFGGICGSLIGGYTLNNLPMDKIFLLFSILPAIQLFSCSLVEESSVADKVLPAHSSQNGGSYLVNGKDSHEENPKSHNNNFPAKKSGKNTYRRKRGQKSIKQGPVAATESEVPLDQGVLTSLKTATFSLIRAFKQPIILR